VILEGGRIRSEADFWAHAAFALNLATIATKSRSDIEKTSISGEGGVDIPLVFKAKAGTDHASEYHETITASYSNVPVIATIEKMLETGTALLVDDFHYISGEIQKAIIQSLKGAVFRGLPVFLLAVPHRAFDPLTVENEVEGRFKHISIPQWSLDDLLQIPNRGFAALNLKVNRAIQRKICEDSFGNPLLVQEICSEYCLMNKISRATLQTQTLDEKLLEITYREMAASKGFPTYQMLQSGPEGRRSRTRRTMKTGEEQDIFSAILAALARLGPKTITTLDALRQSLSEVHDVSATLPARAEVVSALNAMSAVAKTRSKGEPPLEWIKEGGGQLAITDPFLLFYLKWSFRGAGATS
jgi:hypothetical protein